MCLVNKSLWKLTRVNILEIMRTKRLEFQPPPHPIPKYSPVEYIALQYSEQGWGGTTYFAYHVTLY